jgi:hypothetical protein
VTSASCSPVAGFTETMRFAWGMNRTMPQGARPRHPARPSGEDLTGPAPGAVLASPRLKRPQPPTTPPATLAEDGGVMTGVPSRAAQRRVLPGVRPKRRSATAAGRA